MNPKIGKITALFTALMIALLFTGIGYAMWQKTLTITTTVNTGKLDWEIESGSVTIRDPKDPPTIDSTCDVGITHIRLLDKNVGYGTYELKDTDGDGDYDELEVTLGNVYPSYYNHIDFWLHNDGSIPLIVEKVIIQGQEYWSNPGVLNLDLSGDGNPDIELRYGDSFGTQLHYCESVNISFDVHVLQAAAQGQTLTFTISIVAVQYNEYNPPK